MAVFKIKLDGIEPPVCRHGVTVLRPEIPESLMNLEEMENHIIGYEIHQTTVRPIDDEFTLDLIDGKWIAYVSGTVRLAFSHFPDKLPKRHTIGLCRSDWQVCEKSTEVRTRRFVCAVIHFENRGLYPIGGVRQALTRRPTWVESGICLFRKNGKPISLHNEAAVSAIMPLIETAVDRWSTAHWSIIHNHLLTLANVEKPTCPDTELGDLPERFHQ